MKTYIDPKLPADYLAIARAINETHAVTIGGACFMHNFAAHKVLEHFGIRTSIVKGGAVFRTGSGELDAVIWADQNNQASGAYQHFWLVDNKGRIIDFSTKAWKAEMDRDPAVLSGQIEPLQWDIEAPEFIWNYRKAFIGLPGKGNLPAVGKAIYNGAGIVDIDTDDFGINTMVNSIISRIQEVAA